MNNLIVFTVLGMIVLIYLIPFLVAGISTEIERRIRFKERKRRG